MPWIRIDDHFEEHPKLAKVGPLGWAMWLAGLAYCNRNLTDGFIPWSAARALVSWEYLRPHPTEPDKELIYTVDTGTGMKGDRVTCEWVIEMLLDAGIWEEHKGGFLVHDYPDYQPTKIQVLAERERVRKRVEKHRSNGGGNGAVTPEDDRSSNGPVPKPVPVPKGSQTRLSARDARLWKERLEWFRETGIWDEAFGPKPTN